MSQSVSFAPPMISRQANVILVFKAMYSSRESAFSLRLELTPTANTIQAPSARYVSQAISS